MPEGSKLPIASVIIPTYNRGHALRETLECLSRQSVAPADFEVIVADDGSSDDTADMVRSYVDKLVLKYYFQEDRGFRAASARNAGARLASADTLIFIDGGVLTGSNFIREHVSAHERSARGAVLGYIYGFSPYRVMEGLSDLLQSYSPDELVTRYRDDLAFLDWRDAELAKRDYDLNKFAVPWMFFFTGNCSIPASEFWNVGGFDENFQGWGCEDLDLGLRLYKNGLKFLTSKDAWVIEAPHPRNLAANLTSYKHNMGQLLAKHPEPAVEIGWLEALRGGMEQWERDFEDLSVGGDGRDEDVASEIEEACRDLLQPSRVAIIGAGARLPDSLPPSIVIDFDRKLLDRATMSGKHRGHYAIGVRTPLPDRSVDTVIITSRLAGLWERWSDDLLTEASRIGKAVHSFAGTGPP